MFTLLFLTVLCYYKIIEFTDLKGLYSLPFTVKTS